MSYSARLQLLTCLCLYASCAHGIRVKFGTNEGPIVPPTPEPQLPVPQPSRAPAPVWEPRSNDSPDPNAQWRPQLFHPQPRYTDVVFHQPHPAQLPLNNAQRFVNSYIPANPAQAKEQPSPSPIYFKPSQILSSQSLPGFGLRYFVPKYINDTQKRVQENEQANNEVASTDVNGSHQDSGSDLQWKYEKDSTRRLIRHTEEVAAQNPVYVWPQYFAHQ